MIPNPHPSRLILKTSIAVLIGALGFLCLSQQDLEDSSNTAIIPLLKCDQADLSAVFRILTTYSKIEIVPSSTVQATVTLNMQGRPWTEVLDTICAMHQLAAVRESGYIYVLPKTAFAPKIAPTDSVNATQTEPTLLKKTIVPLRYTHASELITAADSLTSENGDVTVLETKNALLIRDVEERIDPIERALLAMDRQTAKVVVDAKLMRFDRGILDSAKMGWLTAHEDRKMVQSRIGKKRSLSEAIGNTGVDSNSEFVFGTVCLKEAASRPDDRAGHTVLSRAKARVSSREKATLFLGQQIPIPTMNSKGTPGTKMIEAGVRISISARVDPGDSIYVEAAMTYQSFLLDPNVGVIPRILQGRGRVRLLSSESLVVTGITREAQNIQDKGELCVCITPNTAKISTTEASLAPSGAPRAPCSAIVLRADEQPVTPLLSSSGGTRRSHASSHSSAKRNEGGPPAKAGEEQVEETALRN